jgi:flagellar biosynthesis/type III secretory pathway M-ring protein FliF/YscJ
MGIDAILIRVVESSPVIVILLVGGFVLVWRTWRDDMKEQIRRMDADRDAAARERAAILEELRAERLAREASEKRQAELAIHVTEAVRHNTIALTELRTAIKDSK